MSLTDAQVTAIRTTGLADTEWERSLRIPAKHIRRARIGQTYTHVPTPPDLIPRRGSGRRGSAAPVKANRRTRWQYFRDC
jgi:hypothetical protein